MRHRRRVFASSLTVAALTAACGDAGSEPPPGPEPVRWVDVRLDFASCALTNRGHVRCWGDRRDGFGIPEAPFEPEDDIVAISLGTALCALSSQGVLRCLGRSDEGFPTRVEGVAAVACGFGSGCYLRVDGSADCWGFEGSTPPPEVFTKVTSGGMQAAGLTEDGRLLQWGERLFRGLNDGVSYRDVEVASDLVLCGHRADDGALDCVGDHAENAPTEAVHRLFPANSGGMCAELEANGQVVCWARDDFMTGVDPIADVPPGIDFITVAPDFVGACGLTTEHEIVCWGEEVAGAFDIPDLPTE